MKVDWNLVGRAIFWGLVGGLTALQTAGGLPKNVVEWAGLVLAILWAGYGKGSTSSKAFGFSRDVWSEDERRAAAGLPPKRLG